MRKIIKGIYNPFIKFYFSNKLKSFTNSKVSTSYLVLDIDNTIADTWKNLTDFKKDRYSYFLNLKPLNGTINHIKKNYDDLPIIFISNRNIMDYDVTKKWLQKNNFNMDESLLILTNNPVDKLNYLKFLSDRFTIHYFDDLSYNHEKGETKFYNEVIDEVKKMDINYYNYDFILNLNK